MPRGDVVESFHFRGFLPFLQGKGQNPKGKTPVADILKIKQTLEKRKIKLRPLDYMSLCNRPKYSIFPENFKCFPEQERLLTGDSLKKNRLFVKVIRFLWFLWSI